MTKAEMWDIARKRERKMFDLYMKQGYSLQRIGYLYHISRERVRQILEVESKRRKVKMLPVRDIENTLGKWKKIRQLMDALGVSVTDVSKVVDVHYRTIVQYLNLGIDKNSAYAQSMLRRKGAADKVEKAVRKCIRKRLEQAKKEYDGIWAEGK